MTEQSSDMDRAKEMRGYAAALPHIRMAIESYKRVIGEADAPSPQHRSTDGEAVCVSGAPSPGKARFARAAAGDQSREGPGTAEEATEHALSGEDSSGPQSALVDEEPDALLGQQSSKMVERVARAIAAKRLNVAPENVGAEAVQLFARPVPDVLEASHHAELVEAATWFADHGVSIFRDVESGHWSRANGASEWMREEDREFRQDLDAALSDLRNILGKIGGGQ